METLPPELLTDMIFPLLSGYEGGQAIVALTCTCTDISAACNENVWRALFAFRFSRVVDRWFSCSPRASPGEMSWRAYFALFDAHWLRWACEENDVVLLRVHGSIYDVTDFVDEHPGGFAFSSASMRSCGGSDVTAAFDFVGHTAFARQELQRMRVLPPPGLAEWPSCEPLRRVHHPKGGKAVLYLLPTRSTWLSWVQGIVAQLTPEWLNVDMRSSASQYRESLLRLVSRADEHEGSVTVSEPLTGARRSLSWRWILQLARPALS